MLNVRSVFTAGVIAAILVITLRSVVLCSIRAADVLCAVLDSISGHVVKNMSEAMAGSLAAGFVMAYVMGLGCITSRLIFRVWGRWVGANERSEKF